MLQEGAWGCEERGVVWGQRGCPKKATLYKALKETWEWAGQYKGPGGSCVTSAGGEKVLKPGRAAGTPRVELVSRSWS